MDERDGHYLKPSAPAEGPTREADVLGQLEGPGVVPLLGQGSNGDLALKRAACSLADVLHERGRLSDGEVRAVGAAAAAALARIHEAGFVHGDIKPANLLLSHDGELWLADFDAATPADGRPLQRFSPGRLSPGAEARPESDLAALAVTIVELATGTLVDPNVSWRPADLRRLGCSAALSIGLSAMLAEPGAVPNAQVAAEMFERGGTLGDGGVRRLPAPATSAHQIDTTPTVEFPLARPRSQSSPRPARPKTTSQRPTHWWQRLRRSAFMS